MTFSAQLGVATVIAAAVGLLSGIGWPGFLVGAAFAGALWGILFAGSFARAEGGVDGAVGVVETRAYAVAAVVGLVLGYLFFRIGGGSESGNAAWWASGFIMAGVLVPAAGAASRHEQ